MQRWKEMGVSSEPFGVTQHPATHPREQGSVWVEPGDESISSHTSNLRPKIGDLIFRPNRPAIRGDSPTIALHTGLDSARVTPDAVPELGTTTLEGRGEAGVGSNALRVV